LDNILCTYVWVRGGGANLKVNTYFALGVTKGSKAESIFISTYLKNDVFTSNPTPQNKLVRDVFISTGRLKYEDIGVWTWNLSSSVMKSTDVKDLLDNRNFIGGYTNNVIAISEATKPSLIPRLLIDKTRRGAIELLTQGTNGVLLNKKQYVFDYIRALKNPYLLDVALNTLQMVAWAEGITLGLRTTTDFMDLGSYYNDVIRDSKADNQRLYLILSRDTTASADAELSSAFGSSLTQGIVQSKGENNAFVVGILVDGVFQNEIDPYMFSAKAQTATPPPNQVTLTRGSSITQADLDLTNKAKAEAIELSQVTTDNVYVIRKQDDTLVVKAGEPNAYNVINSPDFKSIVDVFNNGQRISVPPQPTQQANVTTIVLNSNDLEEIKENAKIASEASTEKMYVVELNDGSYSYEAGADNLFILQSTNELKDVVVVFENGVEMPYNFGYGQPKENISDVFVETTDELTDEDLEGLDNMDDLGEIELDDLEDLPDLDFEQE
jgi:hypothetical protein